MSVSQFIKLKDMNQTRLNVSLLASYRVRRYDSGVVAAEIIFKNISGKDIRCKYDSYLDFVDDLDSLDDCFTDTP